MLASQGNGISQRRRAPLPQKNKALLERWMWRNLGHPYPSGKQRKILAEKAGMSENQVKDWFTNNRRVLKQDPKKWQQRHSARVAAASNQDLSEKQLHGKRPATVVHSISLNLFVDCHVMFNLNVAIYYLDFYSVKFCFVFVYRFF